MAACSFLRQRTYRTATKPPTRTTTNSVVTRLSRFSPSSLYNQDLSSMDIAGGYDQTDARGFIAINALRLKAHRVITRRSRA